MDANKTWNVDAVLVDGMTWSSQVFGTCEDALSLARERAGRPANGWDQAVAFMVVAADGEPSLRFVVDSNCLKCAWQ